MIKNWLLLGKQNFGFFGYSPNILFRNKQYLTFKQH
jgi:hypothetical protein